MPESNHFLCTTIVGLLALSTAHAEGQRLPPLPFPAGDAKPVSQERMEAVYREVRTPYKYGIVLKPEAGEKIDCPTVFRMNGHWYMVFVSIRDGIGYQTELASSDDLLHWKRLGKVLPFSGKGWDQWQANAGIALSDHTWGGTAAWQPYKGKYWATYVGGAKQGYEPDPLSMGVAWTTTPTQVTSWQRYEGNPVLSPAQPDARAFEAKTTYKSDVIWDREKKLGYPFVMFYNGKQQGGNGHEAIGMAVSDDMLHWRRMGDGPVIYNESKGRWSISGDPQITRMGDLWVMFYFGAFWKPKAFDTFAASTDLVHWTKWTGADLIAPSEPYDSDFAHKPWVVKVDGVVYHFYCAVGDQGRGIAVATSRDLGSRDAGKREKTGE
jgi:predicted GH43/DUF377 family glycosyl hydrolase